jgi:DNA primase
MKYPKEYLEEIKLRLKVSQVVAKSVKLKKRGKEFIGLSPFSNEKTPSFTVNDEKGFYHCFSSAEHGNIFDFLMKTKNYKFGEAVRTLAADAGMQQYRFTKQDDERQNRWKIYNSILENGINFSSDTEFDLEIEKIISKILHYQDIIIEVVGSWIWISGNSKSIKEELKELGFKWANKKKMWYYGEMKGRNPKQKSMSDIKAKYGCQTVQTKQQQKLK